MSTPPPAGNTAAAAFDARAEQYDRWFDEHTALYRAELTAVAELLAPVRAAAGAGAEGLEIGVGTGRFAAPLGISHGLEPAPRMARLARARGIDVVAGVAEDLPFGTGRFAYTALLTSLCFVTDPARALREARRVTVGGGAVLVAYLNRVGPPGQELAARQAEDPYYSHAHLMTTPELEALLRGAGFLPEDSRQVLAGPEGAPVVRPGAEEGLFCVLRARAQGAGHTTA
ncbi:type 11 methyltransferase [Kocuria dechangensis]|uniref:Type 11 methyltransferase n=1 Tax=Kocuria dechangensis TaxID=1176249 RepID=A0A917LVA7_9MICC|nr:class I SAM-dependent methyltransferase [Kocuria dechangensis]GGG59739.1 type 11 methyltransferase [Kocuria dechangensis]